MAELKIKADSGGGTVSFKGPATTTSNAAVQLTLPVDDGTANQYLKTDGSGALSWATVAGGVDGISSSADANAITIDSSEHVIVGGTTVSNVHTNNQDFVVGNSSNSNTGMALNCASGGYCSIVMSDSAGDKNKGLLAYNHADDTFKICNDPATGSDGLVLLSNNDVKVANGNLIIGSSGKGIDFSATSDGTTMSSELLDDYEEGSFTATCDNSVTLSWNTLYYTRVGRLCHISGLISVNSDNSNATFTLNNLPFAGNNGFGLSAPFTRVSDWDLASDCKYVSGYTDSNKVYFQQVKDNASVAALPADSGANMIVNLTYYIN